MLESMVQIMQQEMEIKKDSSSKYLVFGLVLSGLIFVMDAQIPLGIADGMLYVVLVLLGLMARNRSFICTPSTECGPYELKS